jgi:hypothetical protein
MDKYFYFFDLNEVLIDRYPAKIATQIKQTNRSDNFIFIYSEEYSYPYPKNIPEGSKAFYLKNLTSKDLNALILKYPPNSLTTIAQRIPDMWMLTFFNHQDIPTFIVQHGLWSDRLERVPLFQLLYGKFSKFVQYTSYVNRICRLNKLPFLVTILDLYRFLLKEDITIPETEYLNNNSLRANKAFVFDKSWDDYYVKKYGYNNDSLIYIGNPDLQLLVGKNLTEKEDAVCYLCQSLVEDGRYPLREYVKFLEILNKTVASQKKLYIKLHPRSKREFYSIFEENNHVVFTNELPFCEYYIAHYTGLLATVKHISDNILIWKLPDHHIPDYFCQFGSVVTSSINELELFISLGSSENVSLPRISGNVQKNEFEDPIQIISENIVRYSLK